MTSDSPVSPPTDQLVAAAKSVLTCCRECRDERDVYDDPVPPAEFIIWGKLAPPEALGPKCYDHAVKHLGHDMPGRSDQYAVVDLRPLRAALASQQGEPDTPAAHDQQGEPLMTLDEFLDTQPFEDSAPPSPTPDQANCDHAATCGRCGLSLDTRHEGGRCWVELHGEAASNWVAGMRADGLLAPAAPEGGELDDLLARADQQARTIRTHELREDSDGKLIADLASALRSQRARAERYKAGTRVLTNELSESVETVERLERELAEARGIAEAVAGRYGEIVKERAAEARGEVLFEGDGRSLCAWAAGLIAADYSLLDAEVLVVRAQEKTE